MKKLTLRSAVVLTALVLAIGGAAVSFAGSQERKENVQQNVSMAIQEKTITAGSPGDAPVSAVKSGGQNMSYEQQGEMMRERKARHDMSLQEHTQK